MQIWLASKGIDRQVSKQANNQAEQGKLERS